MAASHHQVNTANLMLLEKHDHERIQDQNPQRFILGDVIEIGDDDDLNADSKSKGVLFDDEVLILTPLSSQGNNNKDPICVDDYVEVGVASKDSALSRVRLNFALNVDDYDDSDDIRVIPRNFFRPSASPRKRIEPFSAPSVTELGESSSSRSETENNVIFVPENGAQLGGNRTFLCEICADSKPQIDSFTVKGCTHAYCLRCINNYVSIKLQEGDPNVRCPVPGCHGVLDPDYCRHIIPYDLFDRWGDALCESVILASQKFYCPYKDCSALFINDGGETVTKSQCLRCSRVFCAQCKDAWHEGLNCAEYQTLGQGERGREDIMLRQLAKQNKWQRCPKCMFYVEKITGCLFMKCRCGVAFCYHCGAVIKNERNHYCPNCRR